MKFVIYPPRFRDLDVRELVVRIVNNINLYFISNLVLIKFDQLKFLNAVNLSAFPCQAFAFILSPHLLSTTSAHPCY
jgi:hypothetical protein